MTPSIRAVVRLLDEDPHGWVCMENAEIHHELFRLYRFTDGRWAVNGFRCGLLGSWRIAWALGRRRDALVDLYLSRKADTDLARLLSDR